MQVNHGLAPGAVQRHRDLAPLNQAQGRRGSGSSGAPLSYFGTLVHFVRSASPYYEIQTNGPSVPFSLAPPRQSEPPAAQDEGLSDTLSFVHRTCALTSLGSSFLGLPSEVCNLLGAASQCASLGEVVLALGRYMSQASPTSTSLEREADTAPFTEAVPSNDDEEEELYFDALEYLSSELESRPLASPQREENNRRGRGTSRLKGALGVAVGLSCIHAGRSAPLNTSSRTSPPPAFSLGTPLTSIEEEAHTSEEEPRASPSAQTPTSPSLKDVKTTPFSSRTTSVDATPSQSENFTATKSASTNVTRNPLIKASSMPKEQAISEATAQNVTQDDPSWNTSTVGNSTPPIFIRTVKEFQKIGRDAGYPLNGHYEQTGDIDASSMKDSVGDISPFSGIFDGKEFQIKNLTCPLFDKVCCGSQIKNLRVRDALLQERVERRVTGLIVNTLDSNPSDQETKGVSLFENIHVSNSAIHFDSQIRGSGSFIVGESQGTCHFRNVNVTSSNITSLLPFSQLGGLLSECYGVSIENVRVSRVNILTQGVNSVAGGIVAKGFYSKLKGAHIENCAISSAGHFSEAGLVLGYSGNTFEIKDVFVNNSKVTTKGKNAKSGLCVGTKLEYRSSNKSSFPISDLHFKDSHLVAHGKEAVSGGTMGHLTGNLKNIKMENCSVSTSGKQAHAGLIGGNLNGKIKNVSLEDCLVSTLDDGARADVFVGSPSSRFQLDDVRVSNVSVKSAVKTMLSSHANLKTTPLPASAPVVLPMEGLPLGSLGLGIAIGLGVVALGAAMVNYFFPQDAPSNPLEPLESSERLDRLERLEPFEPLHSFDPFDPLSSLNDEVGYKEEELRAKESLVKERISALVEAQLLYYNQLTPEVKRATAEGKAETKSDLMEKSTALDKLMASESLPVPENVEINKLRAVFMHHAKEDLGKYKEQKEPGVPDEAICWYSHNAPFSEEDEEDEENKECLLLN